MHIHRSWIRRTAQLLGVTASVAVVTTAAQSGSAVGHAATGARSFAYGWPVKPFDRQHPIRGGFGDPRTVFFGPPTTESVLTGAGSFTFHFGTDISAPDGTQVYPVVSGTVSEVRADMVGVTTDDGRVFQYWHIQPSVSPDERVQVDQTKLGSILRGARHVHLTEVDGHRIVNPLRKGHLTPYTDTTTPHVRTISFRDDIGSDVLPTFLRGSIEMTAEAYDTPSMPVPGSWHDMPVAPALITWHLQTIGGRRVTPERVAADFRLTIPENQNFWSYYARGTYQNQATFESHFSYRQPGCFLFKLTRGPFDTRTVPDGVYDLVVIVADIRGNHSSAVRRITIHNRPGWTGS
jgi:hypothetical protein